MHYMASFRLLYLDVSYTVSLDRIVPRRGLTIPGCDRRIRPHPRLRCSHRGFLRFLHVQSSMAKLFLEAGPLQSLPRGSRLRVSPITRERH